MIAAKHDLDTNSSAFGGGQDSALLLARVLLGAIFVQSGFGKLAGLAAFTAGMQAQGVPLASLTAPVGAVVEFVGGLAIILGMGTWLAPIVMAGFTVVATLIAHRFWDYPVEQQKMQNIQFMKNVAIVGGLLALAIVGNGRLSIDGLLRRRYGRGRPLSGT